MNKPVKLVPRGNNPDRSIRGIVPDGNQGQPMRHARKIKLGAREIVGAILTYLIFAAMIIGLVALIVWMATGIWRNLTGG